MAFNSVLDDLLGTDKTGGPSWDEKNNGLGGTSEGQAPIAGKGMNLNRDLEIIGYIAGRKNCLTHHIPAKSIKEAYDPLYEKWVTEGRDTKVRAVKMTKEGLKEEDVNEITLDDKASALKLRTINFDKYVELKNRKTYKVNMTELKPEFIMIKNKYAASMNKNNLNVYDTSDGVKNYTAEIEEYTSANSDDSIFSAIKPAKLATLMFTLDMEPMNVVKDDKVVGIVAPTMKKATIKQKEVFRPNLRVFTTPGREEVTQLGYLGIHYVVNRRFEGDQVTPEKIDNLEKFKELFPTQSADNLKLRLVGKKAEKGEESMASKQAIPFSEMKDDAVKIGLDEKMLESLRHATNTTSLSMKEIKDSIDQSKLIFRRMENLKN